MSKTWVRRPVTVLGVIFGALLLTVLLPVWVIVSVAIDIGTRKWRLPTFRLLCFAWLWLWLETFGITGAVLI
ncbi:MAG: hypothetical protein F2561_06860, partial [Actinobacteria bacterium]|nr:hypothetical protein [Actinomycetota bacterium]